MDCFVVFLEVFFSDAMLLVKLSNLIFPLLFLSLPPLLFFIFIWGGGRGACPPLFFPLLLSFFSSFLIAVLRAFLWPSRPPPSPHPVLSSFWFSSDCPVAACLCSVCSALSCLVWAVCLSVRLPVCPSVSLFPLPSSLSPSRFIYLSVYLSVRLSLFLLALTAPPPPHPTLSLSLSRLHRVLSIFFHRILHLFPLFTSDSPLFPPTTVKGLQSQRGT